MRGWIAVAPACTTLRGERSAPQQRWKQAMHKLAPPATQAGDGKVRRHGPEAFEAMSRAGRLAAEALDMLTPHVKPGVTTASLDELVVQFAIDHGAVPAPLNY